MVLGNRGPFPHGRTFVHTLVDVRLTTVDYAARSFPGLFLNSASVMMAFLNQELR